MALVLYYIPTCSGTCAMDLLIAAHAVHVRATLATRNRQEFDRFGGPQNRDLEARRDHLSR